MRLFVDGHAVCGGTLLANRWVITANHCLPSGITPQQITVAYGADAENFRQVQQVIEVQRYPMNFSGVRTRDLALLGVDAPFEIDGSKTAHYFPLFQNWGLSLQVPYRCAGWDFSPDPDSPTDALRVLDFIPVAVEDRADGEVVWWTNSSSSDPLRGDLPTATDSGSGCFFRAGDSDLLATVHVANPDFDSQGAPNDNQESYSLALSEVDIQGWIERVLFGELATGVDTVTDWQLDGNVGACSANEDTIELFGVKTDGSVGRFRRSQPASDWQADTAWTELAALPGPDSTGLLPVNPGVLCWPDGNVDLVATGRDGDLYWQHFDATSALWSPSWQRAASMVGATSGVALIGVKNQSFEAYVRAGPYADLYGTSYRYGWTNSELWLPGPLLGAPAARMGVPGWVDVFVRSTYDELWKGSWWNGSPNWSPMVGVTTGSDPALARFRPERIDVLVRNPDSTLGRLWYEAGYSRAVNGTGLVLPPGEMTVAERGRGRLDVFVSGAGGPLWHGVWPRDPRPTTVSKRREEL